MPRPPRFDRTEALDHAVDVFWEHGWSGTSVRRLGDAMGLGPSSLYGAFGSKAQLFAEVLGRYRERLALGPPSPDAVRAYLSAVVAPRHPAGCLLVVSGIEADELPSEARAVLDRALRDLGHWLATGLGDPSLADEALTVVLGLQLRHRLGTPSPELAKQADRWLHRWLDAPPSPEY